MVASIAALQGCGSVFIQCSRSMRVAGIVPSAYLLPNLFFNPGPMQNGATRVGVPTPRHMTSILEPMTCANSPGCRVQFSDLELEPLGVELNAEARAQAP
jgi:hypothetical protein